jgi:EAL and modified HD-GYP domain-containing signal transduction protein
VLGPLVDTRDPVEGAAAGVVLARQPILDDRERLWGYELLYRPIPSGGRPSDLEAAAASVMISGLADIGLERLVGDRLAFFNVTRQVVLDLRESRFAAKRVVLELLEDQDVDGPLLDALRELRRAGFRIALDDFDLDGGTEPLLEVADIVKLDIRALPPATLAEHVRRLRRRDLILLAEKVEDRAEYRACQELGFDAFQGYYFATPELVQNRRAPTQMLGALATLVRAGPLEFEELEQLISRDAGLSQRFLRLANSAFYAARSPVGSIRRALIRLGTDAVRQWALLLLVSGLRDRPDHLLTLALHRARQCELIAHEVPSAEPDRAFTTGLLSILDALLNRPMDELLAELPLDDRLTSALIEREGPEGRLLAAVIAYERGNFEACAEHGISLLSLSNAYHQALDWVDETTAVTLPGRH